MFVLSHILRIIGLSILFGGSCSIVFAAITLVKAAHANGVPIPEAAAANAPMFYMFSVVALVSAILVLAGEAIDFTVRKRPSRLAKARYISSSLAVAAAMILSFGIVPRMKELTPNIKSNEQAKTAFDQLHHASQLDFSAMIVLALISLLLPGFETIKQNES